MSDDCGRIRPLLGQYADGELDEQAAARVCAHLESCSACQQELAGLRALDQMVQDSDRPPRLAEEYWSWHRARVWKRIRDERRPRQRPYTQGFFWFRLAVATGGVAVMLVVALAGWRLLQPGPKRAKPEMVAAEFDAGAVRDAEAPAVGGRAAKTGSAEFAAGLREEAGKAGRTGDLKAEVADELGDTRAMAGAEEALGRTDAELEPPAERGLVAEQVPASVVATAKAADTDKVVGLALCDVPPAVETMPALPSVPPDETATVFVRALVEADGSVSRVEIERSSGIELLDAIALGNVQQARFKPGVQSGKNVRCWVGVPQYFRTETAEAEEGDSTAPAEGP